MIIDIINNYYTQNFFTWSQPISLIFFPVLFKPNCFVISARFPGLSANEVKSDSQPGASSPVIDRCITTIPALSSSAASILWDFSRASVDKSIWHLSIITMKSQLDNVITWHNYMTKDLITWWISARAEISLRPPDWNIVAITCWISARAQNANFRENVYWGAKTQ